MSSAWKYVKLMEVTVSPDPDDPHMSGSVALVKDGYGSFQFYHFTVLNGKYKNVLIAYPKPFNTLMTRPKYKKLSTHGSHRFHATHYELNSEVPAHLVQV